MKITLLVELDVKRDDGPVVDRELVAESAGDELMARLEGADFDSDGSTYLIETAVARAVRPEP